MKKKKKKKKKERGKQVVAVVSLFQWDPLIVLVDALASACMATEWRQSASRVEGPGGVKKKRKKKRSSSSTRTTRTTTTTKKGPGQQQQAPLITALTRRWWRQGLGAAGGRRWPAVRAGAAILWAGCLGRHWSTVAAPPGPAGGRFCFSVPPPRGRRADEPRAGPTRQRLETTAGAGRRRPAAEQPLRPSARRWPSAPGVVVPPPGVSVVARSFRCPCVGFCRRSVASIVWPWRRRPWRIHLFIGRPFQSPRRLRPPSVAVEAPSTRDAPSPSAAVMSWTTVF